MESNPEKAINREEECVDIDECRYGYHRCDLAAECINTLGSYQVDFQTEHQVLDTTGGRIQFLKFEISATVKKDILVITRQKPRMTQSKPSLAQFSPQMCQIKYVVMLMNVPMELMSVTNMQHVTIKMADIFADVKARM